MKTVNAIGIYLKALLFLGLVSVQSQASLPIRIMVNGGSSVSQGEAMAQHTVMYSTSTQYCSGTLIGDNVILTAAHCLDDHPETLSIYFRGLQNEDPLYMRVTDRYLLHESYRDIKDHDDRNDIALVFFDGGLPPSSRSASLYSASTVPAEGTVFKTAGYGHGSPLGSLAQVDLSIGRYSSQKHLIWAPQTRQMGVCHGDSGGPAFLNTNEGLVLFAITSYAGTVSCDSYAVFTSVLPYLPWINRSIVIQNR